MPTLHIVVCAAPPARNVGTLVDLARDVGWDACVMATPMATRFIDAAALEARTGWPVRSDYKQPEEPDVLPAPDAFIVAPATFNTLNKWAAGIADTFVTGALCEALGSDLPIVAVPYLKDRLARHPAFRPSLERLREHGVRVIYEDAQPPLDGFPWRSAFEVAARST